MSCSGLSSLWRSSHSKDVATSRERLTCRAGCALAMTVGSTLARYVMPWRDPMLGVADTTSRGHEDRALVELGGGIWQITKTPKKKTAAEVTRRWSAPQEGWIKCNTNCAFYPDSCQEAIDHCRAS